MVDRGTFVLHSFIEPHVLAGHYTLHGTQPMAELDVGEHVADVVVSSPRYVMPPDQILSTFPPAMAEGDFGGRLPQIVLKRRTLPWERDPGGPALAANDPPRPWLALVVLAEGEGALSPDPVPVAQCVTPGLVLPDPSDADSPTGYFLTVTQTVVDQVFPTVEDLPLLVHGREVDLADTELANGDDDGWMAVVLANRLPLAVPTTDPLTGQSVSAPVRYLACLVNLEGQVQHLPTDADLTTDDHFHVFGAVQDLRAVTAAAASTDLVVMGTGAAVELSRDIVTARHTAVAAAAAPAPNGAASAWAAPKASASAASKLAQPEDASVAVRKELATGFNLVVSPFVLEPTYRFPVLAHWSFTATNDGDFRSIVQSLDVGLLGTEHGTVYGVDPNSADHTTKVEHANLPGPDDPPHPRARSWPRPGMSRCRRPPGAAMPRRRGIGDRSVHCPPSATVPTSPWPTSATSSAPSRPTVARTSAWRRRSRSGACSACRSPHSSAPWCGGAASSSARRGPTPSARCSRRQRRSRRRWRASPATWVGWSGSR